MDYATLCDTYEAISKTRKRLEKTRLIADLLTQTTNLEPVILLLQGRVFRRIDKSQIGVSAKTMLKALSRVTGANTQTLERAWSKTGDLGLVAETHVDDKTQTTLFTNQLSVEHVQSTIARLATIEGSGSVETKIKTITELLSNATTTEAKYLVRTILEELRIGIAEGTIRDAIIYAYLSKEAGITNGEITDREAYNNTTSVTQSAYDKTNDFVTLAEKAQEGLEALKEVKVRLGTPIKVMLGTLGKNVGEAMNKLGTPTLLQHKYDGFRMEVHKDGDDITIFTRRLENVTEQFPDVVARVKKHVHADTTILDGEAIGVDKQTGKYLPFQDISQRIKRKHGIQEMAEKLPVDIRFFDILHYNGQDLLETPLEQRHEQLKNIIDEEEGIGVAHTLITEDEAAGTTFFDEALKQGEEGLFAKKLDSPYQPGVRVGNWIKIKTTMDPLDCVVIGAEWGEGKRSGWFTSFSLGIRDDEGNLVEIGKAATGLKELPEQGFSFKEITELLQPLIEYEDGRYVQVRPEIVLEIGYEEIQKSPSYTSGYALRFPRILRNRTDEKSVHDISTLDYVQELYEQQ